MSGISTIRLIGELQEECANLGLKIVAPRAHYSNGGEYIAIVPADDSSYPIYSRDAEFFVGTLEELKQWLRGFTFSRAYDYMLFGKKHNSNRDRKEQDYRNQTLVNILASSEFDKK